MHRKLEILTNVGIVMCCALFVATVVRYYWLPARDARPHQIQVGDTVGLPGLDWKANQKTLVLVLQTGCHFCTESAPFYRRLTETVAARPGMQIVAVFPQPPEESSQYLSQLGIPIRKIIQVRFSDLKIAGTPTVLLVGSSGKVEKVWIGKLPKAEEDALLSVN